VTKLRIEQTRIAADRFRADVELHTDDGRRQDVSGEFPFTMTDADHADLRWYLEDYLGSPFEPEQKMAGRIEARMQEIGEELFNALFTSQDGQFLWGKIRENLDGVRVEIASDIQDATTVPWELLREPNAESPLAVAVREFVRSHTHTKQTALEAPHDDLPIRVLLVICRPGKHRDVPFRSVASRLVKALTDDARPLLRLDVLRPATFDRLAEVLRHAHAGDQPYHVVHFDGHGAFLDLEEVIQRWEEAGGDMPRELADVLDIDPQRFSPKTVYPHTPAPGHHGYLVFENPIAATNTRLTDGGEIGRLLVETQVPVLVLNACRSAHAEVEQESDNQPDSSAAPSVPADPTVHEQVRAFGSLAHQVSHEGVSGVVAMRYNVYVVTAAEFVADLYAELVQGRSLGQAATLARKGLADDPLRTIAYDPVPLEDWPVPVVFESFPIRLFPAKEDRPKLNLRISSSRSAEAGSLDPALPKPPDVGFFGRDETLLELDRSFDTQQVVLLHAFAGSGKTQAAAEFARWYALTGGVAGPVLFTSFETYRPLARVLDRIGEVFGPLLERSGINWLALDDDQRRDVALQVFKQIPVLWIWDNVEPIAGFPSTLARSASEGNASDGGATPPPQQSPDPESPDVPRSRVGLVSDTVYTPEEQRELVDFLRDAAGTMAKSKSSASRTTPTASPPIARHSTWRNCCVYEAKPPPQPTTLVVDTKTPPTSATWIRPNTGIGEASN